MAIQSGEKEDGFAQLNERFGGRIRAMYFLSPRNLRLKMESQNAPVFWTDGHVNRDELNGNLHISNFEVLTIARSKHGLLSSDFEVTVYTMNKDLKKVYHSLEAIESMMLPSAEVMLLDAETNLALDELLSARRRQDEGYACQVIETLQGLRRERMLWEM